MSGLGQVVPKRLHSALDGPGGSGGDFSAVFVSFYLSPGVAQTPSKKDRRCGKKHEDARMPGILENSDLGWPCPELSAMAGMSYSTPSSVVAASNVRLPST